MILWNGHKAMVSKPILELNPITPPLTGNEQVPLVQGGATKRASVNDWAAAMAPFFPSPNVQILGGDSIAGGGAITQSQVLTLVNDLANPGTSMFYGTNGAGTRGWYALTFGGTVTSIDTGSGFHVGSTDIEGRVGMLRTWLSVREDGTSKLLFCSARTPNLVKEIERFRKKIVTVHGEAVPIDEGERRRTHAVECLEYLAAYGCPYVKPPSNCARKTWIDMILERRKERSEAWNQRHGSGRPSISLGPT